MFLQHHLIIFITIIYSSVSATIPDALYLTKNGPRGLVLIKKNDTYVYWVRVPELIYKQWIARLKFWRACSIILGIVCLIFAALVLAYIVHGFRTNPGGLFGCLGGVKSDDQLISPNTNLPVNIRQVALKHSLQQVQQQEYDMQKTNYDGAKILTNTLRSQTLET